MGELKFADFQRWVLESLTVLQKSAYADVNKNTQYNRDRGNGNVYFTQPNILPIHTENARQRLESLLFPSDEFLKIDPEPTPTPTPAPEMIDLGGGYVAAVHPNYKRVLGYERFAPKEEYGDDRIMKAVRDMSR